MKTILKLILSAVSVMVTAYILPTVFVADFTTAIIVAVVLGVLNMILKPILVFFTLPINILSLGLFTFFINAGLVLLASHLIDGFHVEGLFSALLFSLIMSLISAFLHSLA